MRAAWPAVLRAGMLATIAVMIALLAGAAPLQRLAQGESRAARCRAALSSVEQLRVAYNSACGGGMRAGRGECLRLAQQLRAAIAQQNAACQ